MSKKLILIASFLISCSAVCFPQKPAEAQIGLSIGFGSQLGQELDYEYKVWLFQMEYKFPLLDWGSWKIPVIISPQFNIAHFKDSKASVTSNHAVELGVNLALLVNKSFGGIFNLYAGLGSGPHYVSDVPDRQVRGFIFSDNVMVGSEFRINSNLCIDFRYTFRHMSNAGIQEPNGGVNNSIFNLGFRKIFIKL